MCYPEFTQKMVLLTKFQKYLIYIRMKCNLIVFQYLLLLFPALSVSCSDFLDRSPQDFTTDKDFFRTETDLRNFANGFYTLFPSNTTFTSTLLVQADNDSDNQCGMSPNPNFVAGQRNVTTSDPTWEFVKIRDCNYFFNIVNSRLANGELSDKGLTKHYIGEVYFFRAYLYFQKIKLFGDLPIITTQLPDDKELLIQASKRVPHNEVVRFILQDLDSAILLMSNNPTAVPDRVHSDVAEFLKSRVALYEATFLKYHANTAFVANGINWPGKEHYPNYQFPAGSLENEYNYFFDIAIESAEKIADKYPLYNNYQQIFNSTDINSIQEILLAKKYGTTITHAATYFLRGGDGGTGLTRNFIESVLDKNGLPTYKDPNYQYRDTSIKKMIEPKDNRLFVSCQIPSVTIKYYRKTDNTPQYSSLPRLNIRTNEGSSTGYSLYKYASLIEDEGRTTSSGTTACPIFRSAEAYLNYLEAYYERNGNLGGKCDDYWRKLRGRAGVDEDYQNTIDNTEMDKEVDFARYSKTVLIDKTLYNIRRERRIEFIAEGMRLSDLKRWRALDMMQNYIVEGVNVYDKLYSQYPEETFEVGSNMSSGADSKYYRPYRLITTNFAYNGYTFHPAHYWSPIPLEQIFLTKQNGKSTIYQNPGWSAEQTSPPFDFD